MSNGQPHCVRVDVARPRAGAAGPRGLAQPSARGRARGAGRAGASGAGGCGGARGAFGGGLAPGAGRTLETLETRSSERSERPRRELPPSRRGRLRQAAAAAPSNVRPRPPERHLGRVVCLVLDAEALPRLSLRGRRTHSASSHRPVDGSLRIPSRSTIVV